MRKKIHVAVVYNEPVTQTEAERKFISEAGILEAGNKTGHTGEKQFVDLSEVGVLDEREDIGRALQAMGFKSTTFNVDSDISRLIAFLKEEEPDVIFNLCESIGNQSIHEMHVAGLYELLGIPYTGSDALTLGLALNKARVKDILRANNLPTPRYQVIKSPMKIILNEDLRYPLIVKPSKEDSSVGISTDSVVENPSDLKKRVRYIIEQFDQPALVEEFIDGRELYVAILGNRKEIILPISEIDMSTLPKLYRRIITYNAKWVKGSEEYECTNGVCPAKIPQETETLLKEYALKAYRLTGCRDYARIDFRLSNDNEPYILEVNPNPDISDDAGFARSSRVYGYKFEELIEKIVDCALERIS
jgi:D-alanine-D-alanine ligase